MRRGIIGFEALSVNCIIGVYPDEREKTQQLLIDLRAEVNLEKSAHSDAIRDTIDYDSLAALVEEIAVKGKFSLLEALADRICDAILEQFSVFSVFVRIKKPGALTLASCSFVEISKDK